MNVPIDRALAYVRSLAAMVERLAGRDIVVRRLHCDWAAFGSWTVEASSSPGELRRSAAIDQRAFNEPGPDVFRVIWDGKDHELTMASTPTTVITMLNQWRQLDSRPCVSHEDALDLAEAWLIDQIRF